MESFDHKLEGKLAILSSKLNFYPFAEYPIFIFNTIAFSPTALFTTVIV